MSEVAKESVVINASFDLAAAILRLQSFDYLQPIAHKETYDVTHLRQTLIHGGELRFLVWSDETIEDAWNAASTVESVHLGNSNHTEAKNSVGNVLRRVGIAAGIISRDFAFGANAEFFAQVRDRVSDYLEWFQGEPNSSWSISPWLDLNSIDNALHYLTTFIGLDSASDAVDAMDELRRTVWLLSQSGVVNVQCAEIEDSGRILAIVYNVNALGRMERQTGDRLSVAVVRWMSDEIPAGELCILLKRHLSANPELPPQQWEPAFAALTDLWVIVHGKGFRDRYYSEIPIEFKNDIRLLIIRLTTAYMCIRRQSER